MKRHLAKRLTSPKALLLLAAALLLAAGVRLPAAESGSLGPAATRLAARPPRAVLWHVGNFRYLDVEPGPTPLVEFVDNLYHPAGATYGMLSVDRKLRFNLFLDALFAAINDSLADGSTGDWCGVKNKAATAGYTVRRFYDSESGRWFVYGKDATQFGQSYFFINPFAKRNVVVEVPHDDDDWNTGVQGARLFKELAARVLIINKNLRNSDPDESDCNETYTHYRQSDVAHEVSNTFHLLHMRYDSLGARFVQLHGFESQTGYRKAVVGDGTRNDDPAVSVANLFAQNLRLEGPAADVASCQENPGDPSPNFCGETNVQGRYTNAPNGDACQDSATSYTGRFLHLEQARTLRDNSQADDGWYWRDVFEALDATWPDCDMNNGATDCTLGPQQTPYETWACP